MTQSRSGNGSMAAPWGSLAEAFTAANASATRKHIFVGGGAGTTTDYAETLSLPNGVSLFGLYEANNGWSRSMTAVTRIDSPTDVGLTVSIYNVPGTIQGMVIRSTDAEVGQSSMGIYALAVVANLRVESTTVIAGNGGDGESFNTATAGCTGGTNAETGSITLGGAGAEACWGGTGGRGGRGGYRSLSGIYLTGGGGIDSSTSASGTSCALPASGDGDNGTTGSNGVAAAHGAAPLAASQYGNVSGSNWRAHLGAEGEDADEGENGGGGGGGGYCRYTFTIAGNTLDVIAVGGGGGGGGQAGGGGQGGLYGTGAGGSFALFAQSSPGFVFVNSTLQSGAGGQGGAGADGGRGGLQGLGRLGSNGQAQSNADGGTGGRGGSGGRGGDGGGGSGGGGGMSVAAYLEGASTFSDLSNAANQFVVGNAGSGGTGGCQSGYLSGSCVGTRAPSGWNGLRCESFASDAQNCIAP